MKKTAVKVEKKKMSRVLKVCVFVAVNLLFICQPVYASGASTVTNGINNLTEIVKAFVSSVGAIIVLWGLFEWGNAMQSNDGMMQSMAFKRIGGGIVMTLGSQIFLTLVA